MENTKKMVYEIEDKPKKKSETLLYAFQHILAMFVACITVPLIIGTSIPATVIAAGIGTLIYLVSTKMKSPVVLSSSFSYLSTMAVAFSLDANPNDGVTGNYLALFLGMAVVGLIYIIVALVIKKVGTKWLFNLLPTIVIGPVIMVIGLQLAGSAINNLTGAAAGDYNLVKIVCGLAALIVTALAAHSKRRNITLIPFVIGMGAGYLLALILTLIGFYGAGSEYFHIIDFAPIVNNFSPFTFKSIIGYDCFSFLRFNNGTFEIGQIITIILAFAPVAFVTMCEHIGDHLNLSEILGRDLLKDPGITRTLIGDGLATAVSGGICGCANTTYGENVAVVGVTRNASVHIIKVAAILSIALGLFSPIMCIVQTIPACVTGGVSIVLYGFIASSGVKLLIKEKTDFSLNRNIFIAAAILVTGIGGLTIQIPLGANFTPITITNVAISLILGIALNKILPQPKKEVKEE